MGPPTGKSEMENTARGPVAFASLPRLFILVMIRFYQACLSPMMPLACRFHPSCSAYAFEAVEKWGVWRGGRLALGRLFHCRPGSRSFGYDPVPEKQGLEARGWRGNLSPDSDT
jgi:hypothetical protein